jgi:hypothetical protein
VPRIGVLMNLASEDPVSIARAKAFAQGLQGLGWIEGRNVRLWASLRRTFSQRGLPSAAVSVCPGGPVDYKQNLIDKGIFPVPVSVVLAPCWWEEI